jgi:hypothetical protein
MLTDQVAGNANDDSDDSSEGEEGSCAVS